MSRNNSTYLIGLPGRVNEITQVRCFALCLADGQAFKWRLSGAGSPAQCQDHGLRSQTGLKTDHQPGDPGIVKHSLSAFFSLLIKAEREQLPTRWFQGIVGSVCRSTEHGLWHIVGPQQIASGEPWEPWHQSSSSDSGLLTPSPVLYQSPPLSMSP